MIGVVATFLIRCSLIALFLPFSALDKVLNHGATVQAAEATIPSRFLANALLAAGLFIEVVMSLAVLTGWFDRIAAALLALYCIATALLWKQFWKAPDFRLKGPSQGREVFWQFLKNFAVAGGFLVLATSGSAIGVRDFIDQPWSSTNPYSLQAEAGSATAPANSVSNGAPP